MIHGIIVRYTPAHLDDGRLREATLVFAEVEAFRLLAGGLAPGNVEYLPMISAFLGAKTWAVKKEEIAISRSIGARGVLFFFDARNLKYGNHAGLTRELLDLEDEAVGLDVLLFLAVDWFDRDELEVLLDAVAATRFQLLVAFGGAEENQACSHEAALGELIGRLGSSRVSCAFWDRAESQKCEAAMRKYGIRLAVTVE